MLQGYLISTYMTLVSLVVVVHSFSPGNTPNNDASFSWSSSSSSSFSASPGNKNGINNNEIKNKNININDIFKKSTHHQNPAPIIEYNDFLPSPNSVLTAENVVYACMDTLMTDQVQGLEVCYSFSSDRCRAAIGSSLDRFQQYANNPVFGYLINCVEWNMINVGPVIPGTLHRGEMQTCLMSARSASSSSVPSKPTTRRTTTWTKPNDNINENMNIANNNDNVIPSSYTDHQFLWTLQKERRPPLEGCWMIHEVLFVKNAWQQTL